MSGEPDALPCDDSPVLESLPDDDSDSNMRRVDDESLTEPALIEVRAEHHESGHGVVDCRIRELDELPLDEDPLGQEKLPAGARCRNGCVGRLSAERPDELQQWQALHKSLSNDELNAVVYRLLAIMGPHTSQGPLSSRLLGVAVCRRCFILLLGIGESRLERLVNWLKLGNADPPS